MTKRNAALILIALAVLAAGAAHAQTLVISPNPLVLNAQAGGSAVQTSVTFTSSDNGATTISFSVVPNSSWISVSNAPSGGWKTPATVIVTVTPTNLSAGTFASSLTVTSSQVQTIPVSVTVSSISVAPSSIAWSYQAGSSNYPGPATLAVTGANGTFTLSKGTNDTWYTAAAYGNPLSAVLVSFNQTVASSLAASTTPYVGTLTITPGGTNPVPVNVTISLTVTASPVVTVSPASLVYNWQSGGSNNQKTQLVTLASNSTQAVTVNVSAPGVSWITLPYSSVTIAASGSTQVLVQVNGDSQGQGSQTGTIQITIPSGALFSNGTNSMTIPVQLNVSAYPLLYASQAQLTYTYQFGSYTYPSSQIITPTSSGGSSQPLNYNVSVPTSTNWLTVPTGILSTSGGSFPVSVTTAGLSPGTYTSSVIITPVANGSGQGTISVPVTLNIVFGTILQVNTQSLVFPYQLGQAAPASQTVAISTSTGSPLNYAISVPSSSTAPWVAVSGSLTGVTDQSVISVGINTSSITSASIASSPLDATISVTATDPTSGLTVNTVSIDVKLYVTSTPQLVVTPAGPLQLSTYPNYGKYPYTDPVTIALTSTSSLPGDALTGIAVSSSVTNQATTGDWLLVGNPASTTATSFTVNGLYNSSTMSQPGTYTGKVTVSAYGPSGSASATALTANSPVTIPATLVVNAAKATVTTPRSDGTMVFVQNKGAQAPASQTVTVTTDGTPLAFSAVVNTGLASWLTISALTGPTPGSFNVTADASNLTTGTYSGAVWVTVPNASGSPFRIPVTFNVNGGTLSASPSSLNFTQILGGAAPASQTVAVTLSPATSTATYTVAASVTTPANGSWLTASGGGTTPGTLTVTVTPGSLSAGTYTGTITVTSTGATGSPISLPVTLTVQQATISAPTTALTFNQLAGGAAPASQAVAVTATPGPVPFTVSASTSSGGSWLTATVGSSGTSGTTPATVQVTANGSALSTGSYSGIVTITGPSGSVNSPISIPVLLNIGSAAVLSVTKSSLTFNASVGQATTPQTVQLTSTSTVPYTVTTTTKDSGTWLTVSPSSGTASSTAVTLTVSANTQNLAAGNYSGTITISSTSSLSPVTIAVSLAVVTIPTPVLTAVKNAASWVASSISPGENIVIGGTGIGPATIAGAALTQSGTALSTTVGNTQVLFDGIAAPIIYASSTQTAVMVPYEVGGRTSTAIQVVYSGVASAAVSYTVTTAAPGIYTQNVQGFGPGSILNQDGITVNGPSTPAAKGSIVAIYMTGEGATSPASTTAGVAGSSGNPLNSPVLAVSATVGGLPATVKYAGSAPGAVYGVMQVNIVIPTGASSGAQALVVNVGTLATQSGVTVAVQ